MMKTNSQTSKISKASMLMAAATTGMVATSQAAVFLYDDTSSTDLSNSSAGANVLTSGNVGDQVIGGLDFVSDSADHFILENLPRGGTITLSYNYTDNDSQLGVIFTFADPDGGVLDTAEAPTDGSVNTNLSGTTSELIIPDSGQIRVSVVNTGTYESQSASQWGVSIEAMTVPEPSGAALLALGSLLAMKRRRI